MDFDQFGRLSKEMAIEVMVMDLCYEMVPHEEARQRAEVESDVCSQKAMQLEFKMSQALTALDKMGYKVEKEEQENDIWQHSEKN